MALDPSVLKVAEAYDKVRELADQLAENPGDRKTTVWHHLAENECRQAVRTAIGRGATWAEIAHHGFDGMPENEARAWFDRQAPEDEPPTP